MKSTGMIMGLALAFMACAPDSATPEYIAAFETKVANLPDPDGLDQTLSQRADALGVSQAAAVIRVDGQSYALYHGNQSGPESLFQAASLSKPVAALGILLLAEQNNIGLDDDIRPLTPSLDFTIIPGGDTPVTLRGLLSHTRGASPGGYPGYPPKWREGGKLPGPIDVVMNPPHRFVPAVRLDGPVGSFQYSGGGYQIALVFAEDISGEPFDTLMRRLVFEPLGMNDSTYAQPIDPDTLHPARIVRAKANFNPGQGVFKGFKSDWYDYPEQAAAGLWTTAEDYARFGQAMLDALTDTDSTIPTSIAQIMTTAMDANYGLGLMVSDTGDSAYGFGHSGLNTGYRALFRVIPKTDSVIVIFSNAPGGAVLNEEFISGVAAGLEP